MPASTVPEAEKPQLAVEILEAEKQPAPEPEKLPKVSESPASVSTKPASAFKEWLSSWMERNPDKDGLDDSYNTRAYDNRPAEFKHIERKTLSNRIAENRKAFGWAPARKARPRKSVPISKSHPRKR
jgi:hypothetical protein